MAGIRTTVVMLQPGAGNVVGGLWGGCSWALAKLCGADFLGGRFVKQDRAPGKAKEETSKSETAGQGKRRVTQNTGRFG